MRLYPDLRLINQPDNTSALAALDLDAGHNLLVLYDGELPFLERVLKAAGYDQPAKQLHLVEWTDNKKGLDLAAILRQLGIQRVMLFGQDLVNLGLHFSVAPYFPVTVAGTTYLISESVAAIAAAKAAGNNAPAGALWRGIQTGFLREPA